MEKGLQYRRTDRAIMNAFIKLVNQGSFEITSLLLITLINPRRSLAMPPVLRRQTEFSDWQYPQ